MQRWRALSNNRVRNSPNTIRADSLLNYVQEWAVGRGHLLLSIGRGDGGISMCWRTVVNEDNLLVGV